MSEEHLLLVERVRSSLVSGPRFPHPRSHADQFIEFLDVWVERGVLVVSFRDRLRPGCEFRFVVELGGEDGEVGFLSVMVADWIDELVESAGGEGLPLDCASGVVWL